MSFLKHAIQQLTDHVIQNMQKSNMSKDSDEFQWDVNVEILFLHSLLGLKPVGVNRFFTMQQIHQRFTNFIQREIHSKELWKHLDSMYDMAALHESEVIPFPNEQKPFELSTDFDDLVQEKYGITLTHSAPENDTDKNGAAPKDSKKPRLKQSLPSASNSKNTFLTPGTVKSTKSTDSRPPSVESTSRARSEAQAKSGKVKRASSPPVSRSSKSDSVANSREETPEPAPTKKKAAESASGKKGQKSEPAVATSASSKKSVASASGTKGKNEVVESSGKKIKPEREVVKKGRASLPAETSNAKKGGKNESKKTESDTSRRSVDNVKSKPERNSTSKSSRHDVESPVPTGSKKQSTGRAAVVESNDKKRRRSKVDDAVKKTPIINKRRRI